MTNEDNNPEIKYCVVCGQVIKPNALLCVGCNCYQDWSRYIFRWSGMVGALASLFPLWTIGFSLYEIAFPSEADLKISVLTCNINHIEVAVFNDGKKSGLIQSVDFKVIRVPKLDNVYRDNRDVIILENKPIKQGDIEILKLSPSNNGSEEFPLKNESSTCKYILEFNLDRFLDKNKNSVKSVECDCAT